MDFTEMSGSDLLDSVCHFVRVDEPAAPDVDATDSAALARNLILGANIYAQAEAQERARDIVTQDIAHLAVRACAAYAIAGDHEGALACERLIQRIAPDSHPARAARRVIWASESAIDMRLDADREEDKRLTLEGEVDNLPEVRGYA